LKSLENEHFLSYMKCSFQVISNFFAFPRLYWAGYDPGLMIRKCKSFSSKK